MDCSNCNWKHPDTCRACKAEQIEARILFKGNAADMTRDEITKAWHFGRKVEPLESLDFGRN